MGGGGGRARDEEGGMEREGGEREEGAREREGWRGRGLGEHKTQRTHTEHTHRTLLGSCSHTTLHYLFLISEHSPVPLWQHQSTRCIRQALYGKEQRTGECLGADKL